MQSQTSSMSKRKLRSKTWASILPDDAVLCLLLVLQLVVDDSSHCQGPGITTQESDGTPGHAPQALLHVLMGHLKVGWVSIHIMQVQIQQSNACTGNRKVASIRNVCSVTSMNLQVWPGSHLGHKPYRKASQWHSLQLPSLLCHLVIWCCLWVDGRSGQQQGLTQEGLKNTELHKILHTITYNFCSKEQKMRPRQTHQHPYTVPVTFAQQRKGKKFIFGKIVLVTQQNWVVTLPIFP